MPPFHLVGDEVVGHADGRVLAQLGDVLWVDVAALVACHAAQQPPHLGVAEVFGEVEPVGLEGDGLRVSPRGLS